MNNFITINNLSFQRNGRVIFQDVDMTVTRGKVTAIMGPSGTGKTTLLKLIGGQITPNQGEVRIDGQNIHQLNRSQLYTLRKRMGMLFQSGGLFTHLNVFDNVAFPLREHTKLSEKMIRTLVLIKLQMVGLRGARELMPSELSGGMSRRVALARAIALDPELIMYDEPLSGQDPIAMGILLKLIRTLNDALEMTTIMVSHDVQETLSIADCAYVISGGRIIGQGTPLDIKSNTSPPLHQFIHGLPDGPMPFHFPTSNIEDDLLQGITG